MPIGHSESKPFPFLSPSLFLVCWDHPLVEANVDGDDWSTFPLAMVWDEPLLTRRCKNSYVVYAQKPL